jgi:membrane protein
LFNILKDLVWNTGKKYFQDNCPQLAAGITYYIIFSLFPFLIFLTGMAGIFLTEELQRDIVDEVLDNIPFSEGAGRNEVNDALNSISGDQAKAIGLIGLAGLLWSSSSMFNAIRRSLNIIYREPEYTRPWFQQKVIDLSFVLGLALFFVASVAATALLEIVRRESEEMAWLGDLSQDMGEFWRLATFAIAFAFSFIAFIVLYTVVPSRRRNLVNAIPGALVASTLFEVAKFGFGYYVTYFRDFDVIFGSLGAIATFLFWVYLCAQIMLIGAEVSSVFSRVKVRKVKQLRFDGFGVPLYIKAYRTVRNLFVTQPQKTEGS